jgi:dTDP-4-dehydrorhamnose reductase
MAKFIIFGGNGMLAFAFKNNKYFADHVAVDIDDIDISNINSLKDYINNHSPEYLINCAAYTDVTAAEKNRETAMNTNAIGAKNLATLAVEFKCKLIHFSTDFVFKGDKNITYTEETVPDPVNFYGYSKMKGEEYITAICPNALIIRVSWLYGPNGKNFVSTISELMKQKDELKIVSDQFGKTTYTIDVAEATAVLITKNACGIFHLANDGVSTRFEFTKKIYELSKETKICDIIPIKASEYPDSTPRPTWSILETDKYTAFTGNKVRHWEDALTEYMS